MSHVAHVDEASVQWHILEVCDRPIGRFVPGVVPLVPLLGRASTSKFWSARRHNRIGRFPTAPRLLASDLAAIAGQSAVDEEAPPPMSDEDMVEEAAEPEESDDDWFARGLGELIEEFGAEGFEGSLEPDAGTPEGVVVALGPASGDVAPPLAPAAQAQDQALSPAGRRGAELTYYVPGGSISFYRSKCSFEAVCECKSHKRCVLTRTHRGRPAGTSGAHPLGGRPVGFLAAWLGSGEACADKQEHWRPEMFLASQERRAHLRSMIAATADGRRLLSFERERGDGEPEELATLHGYVDDRWLQ